MFVKSPIQPHPRIFQIPTPFIRRPIAAGDAIKAVTSAVGIRPCGGCERRRQALNQRIVFRPLP